MCSFLFAGKQTKACHRPDYGSGTCVNTHANASISTDVVQVWLAQMNSFTEQYTMPEAIVYKDESGTVEPYAAYSPPESQNSYKLLVTRKKDLAANPNCACTFGQHEYGLRC